MAKRYLRKVRSKKKLKEVPKFDRPREKMLARGPQSLSNLELVTVLLATGCKNRDVFEVAKDIVNMVQSGFDELSIDSLKSINGVGTVRACQIMAAVEFAGRFLVHETIHVKTYRDILPLIEELRMKKQEYFITVTLDGGHHVIERRVVSIGTLNESLIHPREIFVDAISDRAAAIIFAHNHTSLEVTPSQNDFEITNRLVEVGELVGIEVLDHVIINKLGEFSFRDKGLV